MRILIVGANPSTSSPDSSAFHPDTKSGKKIREWLEAAGAEGHLVMFTNISLQKTKNNKPIASTDVDNDLKHRIIRKNADRIVAVGKTASTYLKKIEVDHLDLPHCSGLNRQLNDKQFEQNTIQRLQLFLSSST